MYCVPRTSLALFILDPLTGSGRIGAYESFRSLRSPVLPRVSPKPLEQARKEVLVAQFGGRETIWASSRIRNSPGQTLEVQTIGAPPEYWTEVIRPGDPHRGQASTATKLAAKDSRK